MGEFFYATCKGLLSAGLEPMSQVTYTSLLTDLKLQDRPKIAPRGSKIGQKRPKRDQVRAKSGQERPKSGQERPKSGPRATKSGQEGSWNDLGAILRHFGAILGSKMCGFHNVF